jgi:hypothetical protein
MKIKRKITRFVCGYNEVNTMKNLSLIKIEVNALKSEKRALKKLIGNENKIESMIVDRDVEINILARKFKNVLRDLA